MINETIAITSHDGLELSKICQLSAVSVVTIFK
jgi:hypothetical protein